MLANTNRRPSWEEDIGDRANKHWTFLLFLMLAIVTFLLPVLVTTVSCQTPAHYSHSFTEMTFHHCAYNGGVKEVYGDTWEEGQQDTGVDMGAGPDQGKNRSPYDGPPPPLRALTWAPWVLLGMALVVRLPFGLASLAHVFFRNVDSIIEDLHQQQQMQYSGQERHRLMSAKIKTLMTDLRANGNRSAYITTVVRKIFTSIISLALFLAVLIWLEPSQHAKQKSNVWSDGPLRLYSNCSLIKEMPTLENDQTVVCVHPVNMVLQDIHLFLVIYTTCLAVFNLVYFPTWVRSYHKDLRELPLTKYINNKDECSSVQNILGDLDSKFVNCLGLDGFYMLSLIRQKFGVFAWAEIVDHLCEQHTAMAAAEKPTKEENGGREQDRTSGEESELQENTANGTNRNLTESNDMVVFLDPPKQSGETEVSKSDTV